MDDLTIQGSDAWLSQGDLFARLPLVNVDVTSNGLLSPSLLDGPAILMSHDCALDKRRAGALVIERINFLPLIAMSTLPASTAALIRGRPDELTPYETMYLGTVQPWGECVAVMSTPTRLPASYLRLEIVNGPDGPEDLRARPTLNDTRVGRISDIRVELLRSKWNTYWTGRKPEGS